MRGSEKTKSRNTIGWIILRQEKQEKFHHLYCNINKEFERTVLKLGGSRNIF